MKCPLLLVQIKDIIHIINDEIVSVPKLGFLSFGDVNQDGVIDGLDVSLVSSHISGEALLTDIEGIFSADINLDESIDSIDLMLIEKAAASGWPTYISDTSALPSQNVLVMHPSLLNLANGLTIEVDGEPVIMNRFVQGYASFMVPITKEAIQSGQFTKRDVSVNLLVGGESQQVFELTIEPPEIKDPSQIVFFDNLVDFNAVTTATIERLNQTIDNYSIPTDEANELKELLANVHEESQNASAELHQLISALTPETLALIESLTLQKKIERNLQFQGQSFQSTERKFNQDIVFSKIGSSDTSCEIPDRANLLMKASIARDVSEGFLKGYSDDVQDTCGALSAISLAAPHFIPIAALCNASATGIDALEKTVGVVTAVIPKLSNNLSLSSDRDIFEIKDTGKITADIEAIANPCPVLSRVWDESYDMFLGSLGKKFAPKLIRNTAFAHTQTIKKISKGIPSKGILTNMKSVFDRIQDGGKYLIASATQSFSKKVCEALDEKESTNIPTCALDKFELFTRNDEPEVGALDKELGIYTGPSVLDCFSPTSKESGNMTIDALLDVSPTYPSGTIELPFKCNYISDGKANLTMSYSNTVISVDNDPPIENEDKTASMSCGVGQIDDVESFTENWALELSNGSTVITWAGDPSWQAQGSWSSGDGTLTYSSPVPKQCVCSGLIKPDTILGGKITTLGEVFNGKTTSYVFNRI